LQATNVAVQQVGQIPRFESTHIYFVSFLFDFVFCLRGIELHRLPAAIYWGAKNDFKV
jgi:hypothetical protein